VAKFNPDVLALWIEQDCTQANFQAVRNLLAWSLRSRIQKYSDEKIAELAEELTPAISSALEKRKTDYAQEGVVPPFEVSIDDGDYYYKALPRPEMSLLNRLRTCSPAGFEIFCKFILARLKAEAVVEGGPHDGGIDFYAIGLSPGPLIEPAPPASKTVVIGQSKRYSATNDVGEVELRSFIGGTIKKADELRRKYPDRFGLLTPVMLAFWTTGDFTPPARKYARDLGVWYLNGVGFSQLAIRIGLSTVDIEAADAEALQMEISESTTTTVR
jgi:hypothetical protein